MPSWLRRVLSYAFFFVAVLAIIIMLAALGFPVAVLAIIPIGFAFVYKIKHTAAGKLMPQDALVQKVTSAGLDMVSRKLNEKKAQEQPDVRTE